MARGLRPRASIPARPALLVGLVVAACEVGRVAPGPEAPRAPESTPAASEARPPGAGAPVHPTASAPPGASVGPGSMRDRYADAPAQATFRGEASYYSDALRGHFTASGERYDPSAFTAAHRTLAFGTVVRVTREDTGSAVYVRINDRGPFRRGRVLDVSRAAAEELGMLRRGIAPVRVEVLEEPKPGRR